MFHELRLSYFSKTSFLSFCPRLSRRALALKAAFSLLEAKYWQQRKSITLYLINIFQTPVVRRSKTYGECCVFSVFSCVWPLLGLRNELVLEATASLTSKNICFLRSASDFVLCSGEYSFAFTNLVWKCAGKRKDYLWRTDPCFFSFLPAFPPPPRWYIL